MDLQNRGMLVDSPSVKAQTRRPHRKTKTGCQSCKRRKIKCDEQRPECENCIKHSLDCEYTLKQENGPHLLVSPDGPSDLNILDLELLHFFCTETALTYHHNPIARRVMSISVPQLGFAHSFVMHGILALSALHIAKLQPERKDTFLPYASHNHELGLQKASLALQTLDDRNASALYIFTALTLLFTVAGNTVHGSENHAILGNGGVAEWIVLSRQSYFIVRIASEALQTGPLSPIFINGTKRHRLQNANLIDAHWNKHLREVAKLIDQNTPDPSHKAAYHETLQQLAQIYTVVDNLVDRGEELETSDIFIWPYRVTDLYLDLLQQGIQEALVILAFFTVLPTRYKNNWFLEDFGISLITRIHPLMDEEHLPWIAWPLQEVGWNPEPTKVHSIYGTPVA